MRFIMQKAKNKKNNPNGVFACRKIVKQPAQVTFNTFYTTLHRSSCIVTKGQTHLNMRSSRPDLLNKHRSVLLFGRYKEGRLFFRLCTRLVTRITLRKKFRCGGKRTGGVADSSWRRVLLVKSVRRMKQRFTNKSKT